MRGRFSLRWAIAALALAATLAHASVTTTGAGKPLVVGGGGSSPAGLNPAITSAGVNLSTTTIANDTFVGNGTAAGRRISIGKCPPGSKCKYELVWAFADAGGELASAGYSVQTIGDHWIGGNDGPGANLSGGAVYTDGKMFGYAITSPGALASLTSTVGKRWAILCDNSTPTNPTLTVTDGTNTTQALPLKPSIDQYAFVEVESTGSGKGGQIFTDPATFTISNAGYGPLS